MHCYNCDPHTSAHYRCRHVAIYMEQVTISNVNVFNDGCLIYKCVLKGHAYSIRVDILPGYNVQQIPNSIVCFMMSVQIHMDCRFSYLETGKNPSTQYGLRVPSVLHKRTESALQCSKEPV